MDSARVTALLHAARQGGERAADQLMPIVYEQLRTLARSYLKSESRGHTLSATALVNEAYIRLIGSDVNWSDRVHFFAIAARQMRRVLVDHARTRGRQKRGGGVERVDLNTSAAVSENMPADVLAVDQALGRLAEFDPRKSEILEMFYFGGMTAEEVGQELQVSEATVNRELKMARAWMHTQLA
jgi:RNA polymerase sigma-70 factor, ECF subfamily